MKVFKDIRKNNDTSQILFSWDWHNKSTLHCNCFNSLGRTKTFKFSFFQLSMPIILAFFSAKSADPTVFRIRILLAFFSAKSANSTVFRIPIVLVTEIFLCEAYRFQKTSQTSDAQKNTPIICHFFQTSTDCDQDELTKDTLDEIIAKHPEKIKWKLFKHFLDNGADINSCYEDGTSPLMMSICDVCILGSRLMLFCVPNLL